MFFLWGIQNPPEEPCGPTQPARLYARGSWVVSSPHTQSSHSVPIFPPTGCSLSLFYFILFYCIYIVKKKVPYLKICIYLHVFLMMCLLRAALRHKKISQLPFSNSERPREDGRKKRNNLNKYKNKYCWDIAFHWVFHLQFMPRYYISLYAFVLLYRPRHMKSFC